MEGAMSPKTLPEIPPELVIEILARLPVKPLFRLKCVCKSWLSLISNDVEFAKKHFHYAKNDTIVNRCMLFLSTSPLQSIDHDALCYGNNLVKRELTFPISGVPPSHILFIGSCNGLIAAVLCSEDSHLIVWNPTTGDFRDLPASNLSVEDIMFWGFGYDSNHDDYKIVIGEHFPSGTLKRLEVFSLKANEWRWSQDVHLDCSSSCCSNALMHWVVYLTEYPGEKVGIVSFDFGEEKFLDMVPIPDNITNKLFDLHLQGEGDNVWVCTSYGCNEGWYDEWYEGWMIKRDGSEISWTKLYSFSRDTLPITCEDWIHVMWVAKNGTLIINVNNRELLLYNPEDQSLLESGVNSKKFGPPFTYMETLVSPKW